MDLNFSQCKQIKCVSHCREFSHPWLYQIQMLNSTSLICPCLALKQEQNYNIWLLNDNSSWSWLWTDCKQSNGEYCREETGLCCVQGDKQTHQMMNATQLSSLLQSPIFSKHPLEKFKPWSYHLIWCSSTVIIMDSYCITYIDKRKLPGDSRSILLDLIPSINF